MMDQAYSALTAAAMDVTGDWHVVAYDQKEEKVYTYRCPGTQWQERDIMIARFTGWGPYAVDDEYDGAIQWEWERFESLEPLDYIYIGADNI
jgi:hypothetical protein